MKCAKCSLKLDQFHESAGIHPTCQPDPFADQIKTELTAIIRWANDNSARSLQAAPGPSELGDPCDRRLAYRLAGIPAVNRRPDPWAAIVGTGIHWWMEQAVKKFLAATGSTDLIPEVKVQPDVLVKGTSDLYHAPLRAVIDYKGAGPDVMRRIRDTDEVPPGYRTQLHLYGMGNINAGRPVDRVVLVFLPRAGHLKDMIVWHEPYDAVVAQQALDRMYAVGRTMLDLDVVGNPARFNDIDANVDEKSCWFCPFRANERQLIGTANGEGCPGA